MMMLLMFLLGAAAQLVCIVVAPRSSIRHDGVLLAEPSPIFIIRGLYTGELLQSVPDAKPTDIHALYNSMHLISSAL
eukprot:COSAG01_NODE_8397_length_2800_cov_21.339504_4_plen_77_part_00